MALFTAHFYFFEAGFARFLTHWIMHGEPLHEMSDNDPARYGKWTTKDYVHEKCRETYGFNNILVYPKEERPYGRKMRINPIYDVRESVFYLGRTALPAVGSCL